MRLRKLQATSSRTFDSDGPITAAPVLYGERLYLANRGERPLCARAEHRQAALGRNGVPGSIGYAPAVDDDRIYVATMEGAVFAIGCQNGRIDWQCDLRTTLAAAPTLVRGQLMYLAPGAMAGCGRWTGQSGRVLNFHRGSEPLTTCAAIADGHLLVGGDNGSGYCLRAQRRRAAAAARGRMLGYSEEELLAASIKDIHPPEEVPNDLQRFQQPRRAECRINEGRPVLRKDGSIFYADIAGHRVFYHDRPCLLALFRDITERKQAEEALRKEHRNLKHLLHSSDHERQLIAYEIHDGLAQQLAGALMQFQAFDHLKDKNPRKRRRLTMQHDHAPQGHFEARRLIAGVRPPILDESGVVEAISHLVHEQGRDKGPKIEYHSRVDFDRLDPTLENAIYRIAQEA